MASLSTVAAGDLGASSNLNQLVEAMNGQGNYPVSMTGVNDASLFALDVKNADPTNGRAFRVQDSSGGTRIQSDVTGVTINQLTISSGTISNSTFLGGNIKNSTISLLAASSNVVQIPQCRVANSATQTIGSGALTAITFDTERWDNDGLHSTTTNPSRITANRAGLWTFGATLRLDPNSTGIVGATLRLNGATAVATQQTLNSAAQVIIVNVATEYQMSTTDYMEVCAFQTAGASIGTVVLANVYPEFWGSLRGST